MSMRIAPRALLCLSVWRAGGSVADTGFDELRELTITSGDKVSLATAMAGQVSALLVHARYREASRLASELTTLIESIDDPTLTRGLLYSPIGAKFSAGEMAEVRRLTQWAIDLTDGDAGKGGAVARSSFITAITLRGAARCALGDPGWKADIDQGVAIVRSFHPTMRALTLLYKYGLVPGGALLPDAAARRETAELLESAERSGDNLTMAAARWVRGLVLVGAEGIEREQGFELLAQAREAALAERFTMAAVTVIDMELAREKARTGDLDGAIELARAVVDDEFETGEMTFRGPATTVLVESLLRRGTDADVHEANGAVERLASVPTDPGFVLHDIWLLRLRALLAQAREDDTGYCDYRDRYRAMATSLGFEGHMPGPRRCHDGGWVAARASRSRGCLSQSTPGRDHGGYAGSVSHHAARPTGEPRSAGAAGSGHHRSRSVRDLGRGAGRQNDLTRAWRPGPPARSSRGPGGRVHPDTGRGRQHLHLRHLLQPPQDEPGQLGVVLGHVRRQRWSRMPRPSDPSCLI